jgi:hypothetical protein
MSDRRYSRDTLNFLMVRSALGNAPALPGARLEPSGTFLFPSFETPREGARLLQRQRRSRCAGMRSLGCCAVYSGISGSTSDAS